MSAREGSYHHFAGKQSLFQAVFESVEEDLLSGVAVTPESGGAFAQLQAGLLGFLEAAATSREVQQVLPIDGPAVLGWQGWRALEERYGLGAIRSLLEEALAEGSIASQPLDALAHILLAAVDEAALYIANSLDPPAAKTEAVATTETPARHRRLAQSCQDLRLGPRREGPTGKRPDVWTETLGLPLALPRLPAVSGCPTRLGTILGLWLRPR